jgi:hypothetical protein
MILVKAKPKYQMPSMPSLPSMPHICVIRISSIGYSITTGKTFLVMFPLIRIA